MPVSYDGRNFATASLSSAPIWADLATMLVPQIFAASVRMLANVAGHFKIDGRRSSISENYIIRKSKYFITADYDAQIKSIIAIYSPK